MASSSSFRLNDLYDDLLVKIFAFVASSSIEDIHRTRLVSRKFCSLSYRPEVLNRASLDISLNRWYKDPLYSSLRWDRFPDDVLDYGQKYDSFLHSCFEAKNPQAPMAIFDLGLRQYFEAIRLESSIGDRGLANIALAAREGITDAAEIYGVILLCLGGEHRQTGFQILRPHRIMLNPSEVLQAEERWERFEMRLWWSLRPGNIMFHLKRRYVKESCHCNGLTMRWFEAPWLGLERFDDFAGMPSVEACEPCLWHVYITRLFSEML